MGVGEEEMKDWLLVSQILMQNSVLDYIKSLIPKGNFEVEGDWQGHKENITCANLLAG